MTASRQAEDAADLQRRRDDHRSRARRCRERAGAARADAERQAWLAEADTLESMADDEDRELRRLEERRRTALGAALHNRQVTCPDLTR